MNDEVKQRSPPPAVAQLRLVRPFASGMKSARIVTSLTTLAIACTALAGGAQPHPIAARIVAVRSQSNTTPAWSAGLMPSGSTLAAAG